jgi:hypothetical protein
VDPVSSRSSERGDLPQRPIDTFEIAALLIEGDPNHPINRTHHPAGSGTFGTGQFNLHSAAHRNRSLMAEPHHWVVSPRVV